jgi:branched-chain amino acid transport system substrate-binding protein
VLRFTTISLRTSDKRIRGKKGRAPADDNEVLIGSATSFSGWMAAFDISPTNAAELAIQNINASGGVLGKKLRLVHIDTKTDAVQTALVAQDLVRQGVRARSF